MTTDCTCRHCQDVAETWTEGVQRRGEYLAAKVQENLYNRRHSLDSLREVFGLNTPTTPPTDDAA